MKTRNSLFVILVSLVSALAFAAVGASVQHIRMTTDGKAATVTIVNTSNKYISAFAVDADMTFPDGTAQHLIYSRDLLSILSNEQRAGGEMNDKAIRPGDTYDYTITFSKPASNVAANIGGVLYTDGTGEGSDEVAYRGLTDTRQMQAKALHDAINILQSAHSVAEAENAVNQALYSNHASYNPNSALGGELLRVLHNLKNDVKRGMSDQAALSANLDDLRQQAQITTSHSKIRRLP